MSKSKFQWAPEGYRTEWQQAPRISGLPIGYFNDRARRVWRCALLAAALALLLSIALAL